MNIILVLADLFRHSKVVLNHVRIYAVVLAIVWTCQNRLTGSRGCLGRSVDMCVKLANLDGCGDINLIRTGCAHICGMP